MEQPHSYSSEQRLLDFFKKGTRLEFRRGEMVQRWDDEPRYVYYITEGIIRAYAINNRGEDYTLLLLTPTEIFPLSWLIDGALREIYFEAGANSIVYRLPIKAVSLEAQTHVNFSYSLLEKVLRHYAVFIDRLHNLEYKYASERLAYRLLFMAARLGIKRDDGSYLINIPISQQLIASSINTSRESVNREFERLQKKGLVRFEGKYIVLLDLDNLMREFPDPISPDWWGLKKSATL